MLFLTRADRSSFLSANQEASKGRDPLLCSYFSDSNMLGWNSLTPRARSSLPSRLYLLCRSSHSLHSWLPDSK